MTLNTIVVGLSAAPYSQIDPAERARAGFFQWCLSLEDPSDVRKEARAAIAKLHYFVSDSLALSEFQDLLVQATRPMPSPKRRRGRGVPTRLQ